jgi:hypothetical protein
MKYEKLHQLVDYHTQLPFPEHPDNDKLAEWILELSEFDGHYLGIANSFLNNKKSEKIDFSDFEKMNNRLTTIVSESDNDRIILDSCYKYMISIKNIIEEINENIENKKIE